MKLSSQQSRSKINWQDETKNSKQTTRSSQRNIADTRLHTPKLEKVKRSSRRNSMNSRIHTTSWFRTEKVFPKQQMMKKRASLLLQKKTSTQAIETQAPFFDTLQTCLENQTSIPESALVYKRSIETDPESQWIQLRTKSTSRETLIKTTDHVSPESLRSRRRPSSTCPLSSKNQSLRSQTAIPRWIASTNAR